MRVKLLSIREASPSARVYRFTSTDGHIPVFQSGQYVNFRLQIGDSQLSRPYTLSSAPYEARGENPFFEVTIRRNVPYLVPDYFLENLHEGDELEANLPFGTFYWEPLRDSKNLVALAGGSGITPFHSMAKEIAFGKMQGVKLTILYGSVKSDDIVLKQELDVIEAKASESVAVALERSGIKINTHCRNGECGFCRSHLLSGEIFVSPVGDGRRRMDKEMGWFHACSSWPLSDLKIKIPIM
ncbi:MAG: iron-sulfur cluster-binding domain-containing protein [Oscillospiraceae bacterium]|nr:iron-sulfur cluster-binding domain-containing protein [Oscillospiraceae bacterium]